MDYISSTSDFLRDGNRIPLVVVFATDDGKSTVLDYIWTDAFDDANEQLKRDTISAIEAAASDMKLKNKF